MNRVHSLALVGLVAPVLIAGGCVSAEKYEKSLQVRRSLQEQLVSVTNERDALKSQLISHDQQLEQARVSLDTMQGDYVSMQSTVEELAVNNRDLAIQLSEMEINALPGTVSRHLAELAARYPEAIEYDEHTGALRFMSDFTFNSGQAELKRESGEGLMSLAELLQSDEANNFEIMVVGHTDDIQPSRSRGKYPTNLYLSAARAIAVRDALVQSGVGAERVTIAGKGEFQPLVPNIKGGTAENRRVEIFLYELADSPTGASMEMAEVAEEYDEPMK
ncbi:MAG: OmpA family protein [Phycisphaerales bacterium]|nr:OmpA family protein [Phycisphaerales bacterium]